ncbi:hypothetical protein TrVFT333_003640 [Trichoderma virens FT-333]|nr:hypothetical protein TrVFT333_003640 [Trichoderma virens FT-333]
MARITEFLRWPVTTVRQAWGDYKVGRAIRQSLPKVDPEEETECEEECDEKSEEECKEDCREDCKDGALDQCEEECRVVNKDQCNDKAPPTQPSPCRNEEQEFEAEYKAQLARSWKYLGEREFPWTHSQLVCEESNWRGTWVLEVKDMRAMNWEIEMVPHETGRGSDFVRMPTRHLPFPLGVPSGQLLPSEGGQDDLMVWLGKS